jgi:uncharacterized protein
MTIPEGRTYAVRVVDQELDELMSGTPAIAIEGAKGVGKTETALRRAATAFRLETRSERDILAAEPGRLLSATQPVLIDEWQRLPVTWDAVRRAVDDGARGGAFILTGSASRDDISTHSGAGRIVTLRMRPLSLYERGLATATVSLGELLAGFGQPVGGRTDVTLTGYVDEIVRSGFPGVRALSGRTLRARLDGYLDRIVDRDFEELGRRVRNPAALRRWLTAYAAATSTTATYEVIRDAATSGVADKPAKTTTSQYRDVLERLWILDPVSAWLPSNNPIARLSTPAKHQLVDPALAARLLGLDASALLVGREGGPPVQRDGTLLGHLFEALITQSVRTYAQLAEARVHHFRTRSGQHEVDLIVERADHRVLAMEVKMANVVDDNDLRHLRWLKREIGSDLLDAVVVTTGSNAYRTTDGIAIVPGALLGP